jgi:hypothetical protein
MAVANLLLPFVIMYLAISNRLFDLPGKYIAAFLFSFLLVAFACWIGFQLWWHRRKKVSEVAEAEFIATPIISEIVQTFGEWIGTLMGILGAGVGLIATIFLGSEAGYLFAMMGMDFLAMGPLVIIMGPVMGFFIIILFRFFAELLRIFAALANNTKEIARNIKNR